MTVQQLIDKLTKINDKSQIIKINDFERDENLDITELCEELDYYTNSKIVVIHYE